MSLEELLSSITKSYSRDLKPAEIKLLGKAYAYGQLAHAGQTRASGESYFETHCASVADRIASLGMEPEVVAAGLLHDTIEDTETTYDDLVKEFSEEIADLVNAVSKLGKLKYKGDERHVESLRKFFLATAKDTRVIVMKLCDRWHNLETLDHLPESKRQRIALESIEIHAKLASRLNMGRLVSILNDLAFPYAFPEEYQKTKKLLDNHLSRENEIITKAYRNLLAELTTALGYQPIVDKRIKGCYSLYKKLSTKDWNIDDVFDIIALRAIVKTPEDCYTALGVVHRLWRPVPGRVKDYIALPKPNGYQSLHTSIFSGKGAIVEIQIRTEAMHAFNEYGVASHHLYKMAKDSGLSKNSASWLRQLGEFQNDGLSGQEYMKQLTDNFFADRIFALTPLGDVIDLPKEATILDFAFALHSDIGCRAIGGRIDGAYKGLDTVIPNESIVEIITNPKSKPSEKWLAWVVSNHARNKIKRELIRQRPKN